MYKFGDLVYFDDLYFSKNTKDNKKGRPCVVLCNDNDKLYICAITSRVNRVNKHPFHYMLISNNIRYYGVLSFIKHTSPILIDNRGIHSMNMSLMDVDKEKLMSKLTYSSENSKNKEVFKKILDRINIEKDINDKPKTYIKIKND